MALGRELQKHCLIAETAKKPSEVSYTVDNPPDNYITTVVRMQVG